MVRAAHPNPSSTILIGIHSERMRLHTENTKFTRSYGMPRYAARTLSALRLHELTNSALVEARTAEKSAMFPGRRRF